MFEAYKEDIEEKNTKLIRRKQKKLMYMYKKNEWETTG